MDQNFGGVIWTNHALERLKQRGIKQGDAWATFNRPDQSRFAKSKGAWVYYKTYGTEKIEVVAKKNEQGKWIILTVWSRPIYGNYTYQKEYKRSAKGGFMANLLKKIFKVQ